MKQRELASSQVSEFYHDDFVRNQVDDFVRSFASQQSSNLKVMDIGGGVGHFAEALQRDFGAEVTVLDMDPKSIAAALGRGLAARYADALNTRCADEAGVVTFNLILHHLVTGRWRSTCEMQKQALANQLSGFEGKRLFVNEYVYESYGWVELASRVIFLVTSSQALSFVGRLISKVLPSLRANTFGVGVCFHSDRTWRRLFEEAGWTVEARLEGTPEHISVPRRLALGLSRCCRNSYVLRRSRPAGSRVPGGWPL